jgi:hypothetical protein
VKRYVWVAAGAAVLLLLASAGAAVMSHTHAGARGVTHVALASSGDAGERTTHKTNATFGPTVVNGSYEGESPAVSSLPVLTILPVNSLVAGDIDKSPNATGVTPQANDPVVQKKHGSTAMSGPIANFDGICLPFSAACGQSSNCDCLPPDTNGEAGLTQYVQMVNSNFAVWSKSGTLLRASTDINQLWSGTTGECAGHNDGDPIVVYDQLANRWVLSQFVANPNTGEQYAQCIAVSTTDDATGTYYRYEFDWGGTFNDYPKLAVWRDAYYMAANQFDGSSGSSAVAFERSAMLNGQPARAVYFDESANPPAPSFVYFGQLASDVDGSKPPPAGTPDYFAEVDDPSTLPPTTQDPQGFDLRIWKFHVDWTNPANSTFGQNGAPDYLIPVAPFVRPQCTYGYGPNCVPQKGGAQMLDVLGERLMFRLAYRNYGDHQSLVLNHTVVANGADGIRWYELRFPNGTPTIYQQGTYAPTDSATDPLWRWMGSIAMDKVGNLALGFSASGPNDYPSVRYVGRNAADALGTLPQHEVTLYTGSGPQTQVEGRWGDYSDLSVDPSDDCTFWYTQEYLGSDLVFGAWRTRIGSFKFANCK